MSGCNGPQGSVLENGSEKIVRSFYHWKQKFELSEEQDELLSKLNIHELYVHYFDVSWNGEAAVPLSPVDIIKETNCKIKPVIYITTEVFENSDSTQVQSLAHRIKDKILAIHGDNLLEEIQIDCDWTPSIKEKYFFLLSELKSLFEDVVISSTIRLYQYKYPELAGVPPVDKGLLMYYNMGEITSYRESNSILNNTEGQKYLGYNEYPLNIDIALPNFSWILLFQAGNFQQICGQLKTQDLLDKSTFKQLDANRFILKKDTVIGNTYFRFGDELRTESCSKDDLIYAAELLKAEINQEQTRIIFYDLQTNTPNDYEKLDAVYSVFEQ